jgi:hypothetical protein
LVLSGQLLKSEGRSLFGVLDCHDWVRYGPQRLTDGLYSVGALEHLVETFPSWKNPIIRLLRQIRKERIPYLLQPIAGSFSVLDILSLGAGISIGDWLYLDS